MSSSSVSLGRNLVSLKWEDFNMFVVSELSALYQKDEMTDVTLFCEGRSFRAHKVLLSLWSSYFRDIFRSTSHSHPVVILKETSCNDLELILRFIYQGHLLIPIEETDRFLKTAEHFQVAGLKNMRNHWNTPGTTSNNATSFHDEQQQQQQQQQQHIHETGVSTVTMQQSQNGGSQHFSRGNICTSSGNLSAPQSSLNPPHSALPSSAPESPSQHQQVIRQGSSSRAPKHVPANLPPPPPPASAVSYSNPSPIHSGVPPSTAGSGGNGGIGVVTRMNESVIYQPQPVLIFQNGIPTQGGVPIIKGEQQYIARSVAGEPGRQEHSTMVIEGVISDSNFHIQSSTTAHGAVGGTPYTVYAAHSSTSPNPNPTHSSSHHSSPVVSANSEEILGLPYSREVVNEDPTPPPISSQPSHHHPHSHVQASHISHHHSPPAEPHSHVMEVIEGHPYTPSTPSSSSFESPIQNGNTSCSNSSSSLPVSSKVSNITVKSNAVTTPGEDSVPVYAVKRVPAPLPPSTPPSSRNFKNTTLSTQIKASTSTLHTGSSGHNLSESAKVATRSKTTGTVKTLAGSSRSSSSSSSSLPSGKKDSYQTDTSSPGGSRSLVSCPKCGKKVKSTSLKVHMKRTHLEPGTVIVCPVCDKRISSKGVYYKHMYIHRKRSETATDKSPVTNVKSETQGT